MLSKLLEPPHVHWIGNLGLVVSPLALGFFQVLAALVCGTVIGFERKYHHKPTGIRTVTLICLGSTVFTMGSILLTRHGGDPSRVASQVVTGIGFLGAGAIIRHQGSIKGLTTAATIWTVAALGVLNGAGYVVPAVALSFVVLCLLVFRLPYEGHGEEEGPGNNHTDMS